MGTRIVIAAVLITGVCWGAEVDPPKQNIHWSIEPRYLSEEEFELESMESLKRHYFTLMMKIQIQKHQLKHCYDCVPKERKGSAMLRITSQQASDSLMSPKEIQEKLVEWGRQEDEVAGIYYSKEWKDAMGDIPPIADTPKKAEVNREAD